MCVATPMDMCINPLTPPSSLPVVYGSPAGSHISLSFDDDTRDSWLLETICFHYASSSAIQAKLGQNEGKRFPGGAAPPLWHHNKQKGLFFVFIKNEGEQRYISSGLIKWLNLGKLVQLQVCFGSSRFLVFLVFWFPQNCSLTAEAKWNRNVKGELYRWLLLQTHSEGGCSDIIWDDGNWNCSISSILSIRNHKRFWWSRLLGLCSPLWSNHRAPPQRSNRPVTAATIPWYVSRVHGVGRDANARQTCSTRPPPSSRQRRRSSVSRGPGSYIQPAWSPSGRSAEPGRGSLCNETPAWGSGFCSVCRMAAWGWSFSARQTPRWETVSVGAPGCWQWPAGHGGPRGLRDLRDC